MRFIYIVNLNPAADPLLINVFIFQLYGHRIGAVFTHRNLPALSQAISAFILP
jgi:hypothetical protein